MTADHRAYLVEDISAGALSPVALRTVIAADAARAASECVGDGAKLLRLRWVDARARDHIVAVVAEKDGRVWTLRAMRWVA
jgi:hypothetical protein